MYRAGIQMTLLYLLLTAVAGTVMRSMSILTMQWFDYSYMLHAHSHMAILGWGYMALFLLLIANFFTDESPRSVQLNTVFWLTQAVIIGMFVAFMLQGYAVFSIGFSTLHILLSYWFTVLVWRRLSKLSANQDSTPLSHTFIKGSLVCLVLSSIGPWVLAILSANDLNGSDWYDAAIYYYLHVQYNGWFTLGLIGVLLRIMEKKGILYQVRLTKLQFRLYVWSLLPSYLLSVLWLFTHVYWHVLAAFGALLQWIAVSLLLLILFRIRSSIMLIFRGWANTFITLAFVALFLKATMEIGASVPGLSTLIYDSRSIVIGYLHLTLLGFVSFLCLAFFLQHDWIVDRSRLGQIGYLLFLIGFILNELVLFGQGLLGWLHVDGLSDDWVWLWAASVGMAVGIGLFSWKSLPKAFSKKVELRSEKCHRK
jgi:hypothetical protein